MAVLYVDARKVTFAVCMSLLQEGVSFWFLLFAFRSCCCMQSRPCKVAMSSDVHQFCTEPENGLGSDLPIAEPARKKPRIGFWKGLQRPSRILRAVRSNDVAEDEEVLRGPASVSELQRWPFIQARELFQHKFYPPGLLMARACSFFSAGLAMSSQFSGRLCAESGMKMQLCGMRQAGAKVHECSVISYAANEKNKECKKMISSYLHRPLHLFSTVSAHVRADKRQEVEAMRPPPLPEHLKKRKKTDEEKAEFLEQSRGAYKRQKTYLHENGRYLFPLGRTSKCSHHPGQQCKMLWPRLPNLPAEQQPVSWDMSGPMCIAFTPMGSQLGDADETQESLNIHLVQSLTSDLDIFSVENSDHLRDEHVVPLIQQYPKWFLVPLIMNTVINGWPGRRGRSWRTCVNQDRFVWVGPRDPADIQRHFLSLFRRTVELCGDDYIIATEEEEQGFRRSLAASRGNYLRAGQLVETKACVTAVAHKRFSEYAEEYTKFPNAKCWIADVSQNIYARRRIGEILPAACTSSQFYSFTRDRYFTDKDLGVSQGWPVSEDAQAYAPLCATKYSMSQHSHARVIGNGMHLAQVGLVALYISCFTVRREEVCRMMPISEIRLSMPEQTAAAMEAQVEQSAVSAAEDGAEVSSDTDAEAAAEHAADAAEAQAEQSAAALEEMPASGAQAGGVDGELDGELPARLAFFVIPG